MESLKELEQLYGSLIVEAGTKQYQIHALNTELKSLNDQLRDLNLKAFALQAKEKEAKEAVDKAVKND